MSAVLLHIVINSINGVCFGFSFVHDQLLVSYLINYNIVISVCLPPSGLVPCPGLVLATFWLHIGLVLASLMLALAWFCLHSGLVLASFWIGSGFILPWLWLHSCLAWPCSGFILSWFWLHLGLVLTWFWLHSGLSL